MEPRGCNWWQAVANRLGLRGRNQAKTVAVDCDRLPETFHGKEGVSGSSPEEGFAISSCLACLSVVRVDGG